MKCRKWILCLLMVTACGVTQADLSPLEKLRSTHPNQWYEVGDVGYDIALMGDDAIPFLIQTLTDEDLSARRSAINFWQTTIRMPVSCPHSRKSFYPSQIYTSV